MGVPAHRFVAHTINLHLLITLPDDHSDFSRTRGIWQRRFWEHTIRDEPNRIRHLDYIHYNAVKHGYVDCPHAWPHSLFHRFVSQGRYD